ncbi:MAG: DUF2845 domain-containing protein [Deltaproteobacteria bacterium]|nr:DUF2845 domain-containing protein [Deltaproteobacteria bacterium]
MKRALMCLATTLASMAIAALGASPALCGIDSLRCGNDVVQTGDNELTLLKACGEPTMKRTESVAVRSGKKGKGTVYQDVHRWYYNRGKNDFIYILTLEGGKITSIETGDRGY